MWKTILTVDGLDINDWVRFDDVDFEFESHPDNMETRVMGGEEYACDSLDDVTSSESLEVWLFGGGSAEDFISHDVRPGDKLLITFDLIDTSINTPEVQEFDCEAVEEDRVILERVVDDEKWESILKARGEGKAR